MKKKFKNINSYLITAIGSIMVVVIVYILKKVAPFGGHSLLTIDFFHQYAPMLGELYNRIFNHRTMVYSFTMGNGIPFFRNFFNYLSSPINILILLFKYKHLLSSFSFVIGVKAVLSSLTMLFYLNNKFKEKYRFIPLAILYAFNAYFVAYYWNIMWIDGIYMLPLIALGIEWLIDKNKPLLYIISLSVMLFINYFIGYMICIFSVIYFIIYLITTIKEDKKILKKLVLFFVSSILSGGMCAFFLIPLFLTLKDISATGDAWPLSQYYNFSLIELFFNHFSGVTSTVLKSDFKSAPNISCGIISFVLLLSFWFNNKIELRKKICYTSFLIFLIISFFFAPLDYIWHAMHVPNDLPFRYSFIYCFILTVISAYAINKIEYLEKKYAIIIYIFCLIVLSISKIFHIVDFDNHRIILNVVIVTIIYLIYIFFVVNKNNKFKKYLFLIFLIISIVDSVLTINNNWNIDQKIQAFYNDYDKIKEINKFINMSDNDKFYRIGELDLLTFNDSSWYNYYGNVSFSSMEYEKVAKLIYDLGVPGNEINSYYYKQTTPIYDMMFDIKYVIGEVNDYNIFDIYYEDDEIKVYRNKYNLGLMYAVNDEVTNYSNVYNPFVNLNNYLYLATGIEDVILPIDDMQSEIVYENNGQTIIKYTVKNINDNYYFYFNDYSVDFACVGNMLYYLNDSYINEYDYNFDNYNLVDYNERYVINEKFDGEYVEFYVGYNYYDGDYFSLYRLDRNKFQIVYDYLYNNRVEITDFKEKYIKGNFNSDHDKLIYTSISYDKGWNVYIDGKKVKTVKLLDALLGFNVPKGEHIIELKYKIPYFGISIVISILSLIGVIFLIGYKKRRCFKWN